MAGARGNADTWTVVFEDSNGVATDPDGNVTWTASRYEDGTGVLDTETQTLAQKTATGTFVYVYTPTTAGPYYVKASAVVGGAEQATEATLREVNN